MVDWLTEKLMAWCERTGRVLKITGSDGPDDIYLIRYYVVKSKWFNVFIHQFMRSDRDDMHDHPWSFLTYLVRGAYTETKWNAEKNCEEITRRQASWTGSHSGPMRPGHLYPKNRLVFRRATDQHKVMVDQHLDFNHKSMAPLTVCVTGPTVREWGFVKEEKIGLGDVSSIQDAMKLIEQRRMHHKERAVIQLSNKPHEITVYKCNRKWVPWREYLELPPDEPGRG